MLRVMDDSDRSTSRLGRWGTMSLLGVLTLTASALRGPADEPHGVTSVKPSTPQIAPFDLSLLVPAADADGVYGVRPAALLKRPGAERLVKVINQQIGAGTALLGLGQPGIHIEDVDQLMGRVYFKGKNKTGKRQLMLSANVLRTTRDIDWVKLRDQCTLKLTQHHLQGETYVSFAMPPMLAGIVGPDSRGYLWAADARTLVFDTEDNIRMLIAAKITRAPVAAPAYTAGWERVNRCLIALAYDNTGQRLAHKTMTPQEIEHALADRSKPDYFAARLYQQFSALVMGSDGEDDISLHLQLSAETPATAARMARECKALVATAKRKLEQEKPPKDADSLALAGVQLYRRLLDHAAVQCAGMLVTVHTKADSGLNSLLQFYMRQMMPDVP